MNPNWLIKLKSHEDYRNLCLLLLVGVVLRFWGIGYGLPSVYNSTEYFIAKHALSFGARKSLEPLYFIYPTVYSYVISLLFALYFVLGKFVGWFPGSLDFAIKFLTDPSSFYLLGRALNAIAVLIAVIIFYQSIRKLIPAKFSLLIALLLLLSTNIHFFTFWMVPDAFLILGSVIVLHYIIESEFINLSLKQVVVGSFICGLTISTKYNAGFLAAGWLFSLLYNYFPGKSSKSRRLILAILFILIGFLAGSPYWILDFSRFWEGFRTIWSQSQYSYNYQAGTPYLWEFFAFLKTEWLLGLILLLLIFSLPIGRKRLNILLSVIILPTFLVVGSWEKKGLDYLLIIFPSLLVVLSVWIRALLEKFTVSEKWLSRILILTILLNLPRIVFADYLRTSPDSRKIASQWILKNVPPGSRICYDHYHYDLDLLDVSRFTAYGAGSKFLSPELKKRLLRFQKASNNYRFVPPRKTIDAPEVSDCLLERIKNQPFLWEYFTNPYKMLDEIKSEGVSYLILNSDTYLKFLDNAPPPKWNPIREEFLRKKDFYSQVFSNYQPAFVVHAAWNRPGPTIKIYRLRKEE